jgi:hypothetical protein
VKPVDQENVVKLEVGLLSLRRCPACQNPIPGDHQLVPEALGLPDPKCPETLRSQQRGLHLLQAWDRGESLLRSLTVFVNEARSVPG